MSNLSLSPGRPRKMPSTWKELHEYFVSGFMHSWICKQNTKLSQVPQPLDSWDWSLVMPIPFLSSSCWPLSQGPCTCYASALPLSRIPGLVFLTYVTLCIPNWPQSENSPASAFPSAGMCIPSCLTSFLVLTISEALVCLCSSIYPQFPSQSHPMAVFCLFWNRELQDACCVWPRPQRHGWNTGEALTQHLLCARCCSKNCIHINQQSFITVQRCSGGYILTQSPGRLSKLRSCLTSARLRSCLQPDP